MANFEHGIDGINFLTQNFLPGLKLRVMRCDEWANRIISLDELSIEQAIERASERAIKRGKWLVELYRASEKGERNLAFEEGIRSVKIKEGMIDVNEVNKHSATQIDD